MLVSVLQRRTTGTFVATDVATGEKGDMPDERTLWERRDFPVLCAIAAYDEQGGIADSSRIAGDAGVTEGEVSVSVRALAEDGYLDTEVLATSPYTVGASIVAPLRITGKARRAVGQWPSEDRYEAIIGGLERMIAAEPDPGKRSRLEKLRDGVVSVGREVLISVLSTAASGRIP